MLPRAVRLCRPALRRTQFVSSCREYTSPPSTPVAELQKTPLHSLHVKSGAKMVPFAGFSMPIAYSYHSITDSHHHVRSKAGLFDVSHMVQHRFKGPGAISFLQYLTPSDLTLLQPHQTTLSIFLHPVTSGIVDDLVITMLNPEEFYVVTNAACKNKDLAYISEHITDFKFVTHEVIPDAALLALQGPLSSRILQEFLLRSAGGKEVDLAKVYFGTSTFVQTREHGRLHIARGGYTGEDGFEISVPALAATSLAEELIKISPENVKLAGLGVRDTLRLEAGMCLYGHDLDDATTPIEAGLKWVVAKTRVAEGGFLGHETVSRQYADWKLVEKRRVGFVVEGAPAREGAEVVSAGEVVGKITSGCPSPTLGKNIAMGYVKSGLHKSGTELAVKVRGKERKAVVTKMPFVETKYYKAP